MKGKISIQRYQSPCGELLLGAFGNRLCLCNWAEELHPKRVENRLQALLNAKFTEEPAPVVQEAARQLDEYFKGERRTLDEYFKGERRTFDMPLLFVGTDFQKNVWQELLKIPYGATITYADLAVRLGRPKAVRAVANANGANALSIFAPCHRVVGSNGTFGGYAGGIEAKSFLLDLERNND